MADDTTRSRSDYPHFRRIETRWNDNDLYGHLNNVIYYELIDSVVNRYLIDVGGFDIFEGPAIGITPESRCRYFKPLRYPDILDAGLRIERLGRSSVVYDVGLFKVGDEEVAAIGHFVHVFVDRLAQDKPISIPANIRAGLEKILAPINVTET